MTRITNLLLEADATRPQWVIDSFPIIQGIIVAIMALCSIVLIVAILVSPPETGSGNNPITGVNESYYSKNKNTNNMGRIRNIIIICSSIIAFCSIVYFVLYGIYSE
jgi:preprotein translocase subunit SecG